MAKAPSDSIKYNIYADVDINGIVNKPDVVGAIFGQAEGLLGEELELRDLQKTGRIGRIEVEMKAVNGRSVGTLTIPSSLDMTETSIIGAAIETVDRIGPCSAKIAIKDIEDARTVKRAKVIGRAKELLKKLMDEKMPETQKMTEEVRESVQLNEIINYEGFEAGPGIKDSDSVIIVEGRADVLNLMRAGIRNCIAVGGTNISNKIGEITNSKTAVAFVDGDRGGAMILKALAQMADIDFVARAPQGKEVEELTKKEIIMNLRKKIPTSQISELAALRPKTEASKEVTGVEGDLLEELKTIRGKLKARLFDDNLNIISEIDVKDLFESIGNVKPKSIVFDGIITQRLVDTASKNNVVNIVGANKTSISNPRKINIIVPGK